MTRNGKIARLPQPIREQINRRLLNGDEGKLIAEWLNTLPEVTGLMAAEFDGQPINETNLSNWKLGGYRDWEAQQEALEAVRRFGADAVELSQAAPAAQLSQAAPGAQLADQLALCLTARLALALQKAPSGEEDPAVQLDRLRQFNKDIALLRKGDHNAQWLRIESGKLDLYLKKYEDQAAARKRQMNPFKDRSECGISDETIALIEKELNLF
jgi:hypothetical protein